MGKSIDKICNNNSCCLNDEIIKKEPETLFKPKINLKKRKLTRFNTFQITNKLSETITSKQNLENINEDIVLFNTENNSFISNKEISLDGNLNLSLITINSDNNEGNEVKKSIKKSNLKKNDTKISKIQIKYQKKSLFNNLSIRSVSKLNKLLSSTIDSKQNEMIEKNENLIESKIFNGSLIYKGELCTFKGEIIKNNPLNGKGILQLKSGEILEGTFINGKLNKNGKYTDIDGTVYEGEFKDGILNGKGKITQLNENKSNSRTKSILEKITYYGDILDFKKEGLGEEVSQDYIYKGYFHNNMKNGKGKMTFIETGETYDGEFKNNEFSGFGTYKWNNNCEYTGNFANGKMNGKGKFKWSDGREYNGEYINGIREGFGNFKWSDGLKFEGVFKKGKPYGKGLVENNNANFNVKYKNGKVKKLKQILTD